MGEKLVYWCVSVFAHVCVHVSVPVCVEFSTGPTVHIPCVR